MGVTFIHTADWQLGKPFANVEDSHKRSLLQQERLTAVRRIAAVAKERHAAFVVVAGDLFDSTSPTKATVSAACSAIGDIGVPVFVIPGNHDHAGPGSIWEQPFFQRERAQLAPLLEVLTSPTPIERAGALILPCPLLRRHDATDPTAWLRNANAWANHSPQLPRIIIAHGSVQDFGSRSDEDDGADESVNRVDVSRLSADAYDYIALGDWHGTKQIALHAWYAGTPELDRFPKGEDQQPGGVLVVTAARAEPPRVERVATAGFRWHELALTLTDDASLAELERRFDALVENRAGEDLVRLELDGMLGMEAMSRLEDRLEAWRARLLRVRLSNRIVLAPSADELQALVARANDPLIARVASALVARAQLNGEEAEIATLALRELHAACR
jgi:DNA repair exonuclease SbcCD nuclease subunit